VNFVIIVTYNALPWIDKCLQSIPSTSTIVIIDNKSTDNTIKYIKEEYPKVILLPQEQNLGFGAANNVGIKNAISRGATSVFLLNQDAYLKQGCIEALIDVSKKNPQFGILSPIHLNGSGTSLDKSFANYIAPKHCPELLSDVLIKQCTKELYEVPFVNAAGWFIPVSALKNVGGFAPCFFMYGEDNNLCQRMRYHGYKIGVVPSVFMLHDREFRESDKKNKDHTQYLKKQELEWLKFYGNINRSDSQKDFNNEIRKLQKRKRIHLLKCNFNKIKALNQEIELLHNIFKKTQTLVGIVKNKGPHYLE